MQKLIGFDIRTPGRLGVGTENWPNEAAPFRPKGYRERAWITFDKYVNPSKFLHEEKKRERNLEEYDGPVIASGANTGFDLFFLWDDAMDMMSYYPDLEDAGDAAFAYAWVDLSSYGVEPPDDEGFEILTSRNTNPAQIDDTWPLLGYDFSSMYFISALAGFDHRHSSLDFITWLKPQINDLGLLAADTLESVSEALKRVNIEIKEDDFFAVAIYALFDFSGRLVV